MTSGAPPTDTSPPGAAPPRNTARRLLDEAASIAREAAVRWVDDNCLRLGAALAYYAVFSVFPLLLLAVTVVGFLLGDSPEARSRLLDLLTSTTSTELRPLFDETLLDMQRHQTARGVGAFVGVVTLLFGSSAMFSELDASLNQIWRVPPAASTSFWRAVLAAVRGKAVSFLVVVAAAAAILASLALSSVLSAVGHRVEGVAPPLVGHVTFWILVEAATSVAVMTLIIGLMYRLIPHTRVEWRDVLGSALLTAIVFTALKRLLAWYLGHLASFAAYGAVGGFLGLLTWIYLASLLLFFGAELARVYAERRGSLSLAAVAQESPPVKVPSEPLSPS